MGIVVHASNMLDAPPATSSMDTLPAASSAASASGLGRRLAGEWNDAHSAEIATGEKHEKHKFAPEAKDCAEVNTDRLSDPESVKTDNWPGGFYMEVWVDGWDVDKTVTLDFHTAEIEFPKRACQNVKVVAFSETTVTLLLVQQKWICCESFGCALCAASCLTTTSA